MVIEQTVPLRDFIGMGLKERDNELTKAYNITREGLDHIRDIAYLDEYEGLIEAVKHLYYKSGKKLHCINMTLASSIAFDNPKHNSNIHRGRRIVLNEHSEERDRLSLLGLDVPAIYFIERDLGLTSSNLIEVKESGLYPNFEADIFDFIRNVTLPEDFERVESRILGMMWFNSSIRIDPGVSYCTQIFSKKNNSSTIKDCFLPGFQEMFHILGSYRDQEYTNEFPNDVEIHDIRKNLTFNSKALSTWSVDDLGYDMKNHLVLPTVDYDEQGFVEGIISILPSISEIDLSPDKKRFMLIFTRKYEDQLKLIRKLILDQDYRADRVIENKFRGRGLSDHTHKFSVKFTRDDIIRTDFINQEQNYSTFENLEFLPKKLRRHLSAEERNLPNAISLGLEIMEEYDGKIPGFDYFNSNCSWVIRFVKGNSKFDGFGDFRELVKRIYDNGVRAT